MIHAIRPLGVPAMHLAQAPSKPQAQTHVTLFKDCLLRSIREADTARIPTAGNAGVTLETMAQVRNELVHAYQELQNIRV